MRFSTGCSGSDAKSAGWARLPSFPADARHGVSDDLRAKQTLLDAPTDRSYSTQSTGRMHKGHEATRVLRAIFVALVLSIRLPRFMVETSLAG
jgi:hypothetical protein